MIVKQQQLTIDIYPLPGIKLTGNHAIKDHINLTGTAIKDIGFVPLGELYTAHNDPNAIIVVGIKAGTTISDKEAELLKEAGAKAYSYSLIEPALYAAANGYQLNATGIVPEIPKGFKLFSANTGLKTTGKKDIGIIHSETPCLWAGCFTTNSARAACVNNNISQLGQKISALICNSGNANACTGTEGNVNDHKLRELTAKLLKINPQEVLTASTGKIGVQLEMSVISQTIESISTADSDVLGFAEAILTTDLVIKVSAKASWLGMTKGSGMIAPNMATMLAFIISDVRIKGLNETESQKVFQQSLSEITARTFNRISVDGDTSTNDMVVFMSNGKGQEISIEEFKSNLEAICKDLALKIIADGEGVTKIIELKITGYKDQVSAITIGNNIINSPLVKTALHGCDPNWGRIVAACGKGQKINLEQLELSFFDVIVFSKGLPTDFDKITLAKRMRKNKFIPVSLNLGETHSETCLQFWGTDLSYDYVKINAEYFT